MVINFIKDYWREILSVVALLTTTILWIVRKRPVKVLDTIKEFICRVIPTLIREAETFFPVGDGKKKLDFVRKKTVELIEESFPGYKIDTEMVKFIVDQVENILATPIKKESEVFYAKIRK